MTSSTTSSQSGATSRPRGLLPAAVAVALEALILVGYGIYIGYESMVAKATEQDAAVVMSVFYVLLGVVLAVLARAVAAGRRWAASPVLLWQLLQLTVAIPALKTALPLGVALLALSLTAAAGVLMASLGRSRSALD